MASKLRFKQQLQLWMFFLMISNCSLTSSTTGEDEEIVTEIVFSVSSSHDPGNSNRTAKLPLKRRSSTEVPLPQLAPVGITAEPQQLDPQVTDSIEFKRDSDTQNETREALALEGSQRDSVVFVSDSAGYVPVSAIRPRKSGVGGLNNAGLPRADSTGTPVTGLETEVEPGQDLGTGLSGAASDLIDWHIHHDTWDREYRRYRFNNTRVQHIEAECQDDYMKIRIGFNGTFTGLVYSAGYAYDPDCMYINGTGRDYYEFYIQLNRCGTLGKNTHHEDNRKNPTKNFMWNTVTVQYNPLIEEEFDEHFKVTCEYGYDFWKTVTFPFLDVEVATGNPVVFTLTPPECYMEIRYGYGTSGSRVGGPVRVGDPLTLIIYMRSKYDGFDIVVNDCYAHNGATKKIQLIDEYGCPVDDKLISRFRGSWSDSGVFETQVFAYMKTFRFTGSPALYIECDVRMCHGRCPTQPCHWRNTKNIQKRSLPSEGPSILSAALTASTTKSPSLSENINLFQSLRVLQEGEGEEDGAFSSERLQSQTADPGSVCMKTGWFGAMLTLGAATLCALGGASFAMYMRLHRHKQLSSSSQVGSVAFDGYMTHKGRIN